jgi:hypothetical protein
MRAIKEMRGYLELKSKLEAAELKKVSPGAAGEPQTRSLSDEELGVSALQYVCWRTKGFDPLRIWLLKALHDKVMHLVEAKLSAKEIAQQMTLRALGGHDVTLMERIYGLLHHEELVGREQEVGRSIVEWVRRGFEGVSRDTAGG